MNKNKIIKLSKTFFILSLGLLILTGCGGGSSGGNNNSIEENTGIEDNGYGFIEGFIYRTNDGDYVFENRQGTETPVQGGQIEINGTIYSTNKEGYFKSSKLKANKEYDINIVVENNNKENFIWRRKITIYKNKTVNLAKIAIKKNWNLILFISDKTNSELSSLEDSVDYFYNQINTNLDLKELNFFIIHGKYQNGREINKKYQLTKNGKIELENYGSVDFGDPSFYRREIKKINNNNPTKKTMVTMFSHGNGWLYSNNPGRPGNWLSNDKAHNETGISSLDSHELYEIFNNIGFDIDLFNFAACHMGQIEIISNLPREVKYAMASPSFGYTEDVNVHFDLIKDMNSGILDTEALGINYIDNYINNLNNFPEDYASVKALYDLRNMKSFVNHFGRFSLKLKELLKNDGKTFMDFKNNILNSNQHIQSYYNDESDISLIREKDIVGILEYIKDRPTLYTNDISIIAEDLYDFSKNIIIYSKYSNGIEKKIANKKGKEYTYQESNGLSITARDQTGMYNGTWFNQKTNWYNVLKLTE